MRTTWTRLVAVAFCKTSGGLVIEIRLSGGTTSADTDQHRHYDDDQYQDANDQHYRLD